MWTAEATEGQHASMTNKGSSRIPNSLIPSLIFDLLVSLELLVCWLGNQTCKKLCCLTNCFLKKENKRMCCSTNNSHRSLNVRRLSVWAILPERTERDTNYLHYCSNFSKHWKKKNTKVSNSFYKARKAFKNIIFKNKPIGQNFQS